MRSALAAVLGLPILLTGCAIEPSSGPIAEPGVPIQGSVHGGQQPIVGANIYLLAANTTGYGGAGIAASSSNASVSLLSGTGGSDAIGSYVTSGAGGSFTITGKYSCTPDTQVYLYAVGGDSGAGTNTAAGLMAALGNCPSTGSFKATTPFININEVSTVAAAYAFAGFASDATHVSSSGTALAKTGIKNAFANAANLVDISLGSARLATPAGNGAVPQSLLNTLGNILAACINSNGALNGPSNPSACYTLFNNAKSAGSTGTVPTDTAAAAINIAHNPGANIATLAGLPTAQAPFAPTLSSTPKDFTVGIEFTGGGIDDPVAIAIDGAGNVWLADHGGGAGLVSKLSPAGVALSPAGGFVASTVSQFNGIAIDPGDNVWLPAYLSGSLIKLDSSGSVLSGSTGYTASTIIAPYNLAIDGSGNAWVTDCGNSSTCAGPFNVTEVSNVGAVLSGVNSYLGATKIPVSIAMDASGNAWIVDRDSSTLTEFSKTGTLLSGAGFTGGGLNKPYAIAIDHSGNLWIASYGSSFSSVTEMSNTGAAISPSGGYTAGGIDSPRAIAVDGAGQVWVANTGTSNVMELSSSGSAISPDLGYTGGNLNDPYGIAIDASGNVWTANLFTSTGVGTGSVTQLIGAAAPVVTPLSVGVRDNTLGARP